MTESRLPDEKKMILGAVGRGKKVLEVGCSAGSFTRHLREQGCAVTGIELDPAAAAKARAEAEQVVEGDADDPAVWNALDRAFDVILFMHVLEHVVDPWRVLSDAKRFLRPGGFVLILLPNVACWEIRSRLFFKGTFLYRDFGILDLSHLRFFTLDSAKALILGAGFSITRCEIAGATVPLAGRFRKLPLLRHLAPIWERVWIKFFPNLCGATFFFHATPET